MKKCLNKKRFIRHFVRNTYCSVVFTNKRSQAKVDTVYFGIVYATNPGLVAYRQYLHNCSSLEDPYWLTAVSQLSAPLLPWTCLRRGSPLLSLDSAMTHSR